MGMAKEMPGVTFMLLIPMASPSRLIRGPPEQSANCFRGPPVQAVSRSRSSGLSQNDFVQTEFTISALVLGLRQ